MNNVKKHLGLIGSIYFVYSIFILIKTITIYFSVDSNIYLGLNNINNFYLLLIMLAVALLIALSYFKVNRISYLIIIFSTIFLVTINTICYYNRDSLVIISLLLSALLYTIPKNQLFTNKKGSK